MKYYNDAFFCCFPEARNIFSESRVLHSGWKKKNRLATSNNANGGWGGGGGSHEKTVLRNGEAYLKGEYFL